MKNNESPLHDKMLKLFCEHGFLVRKGRSVGMTPELGMGFENWGSRLKNDRLRDYQKAWTDFLHYGRPLPLGFKPGFIRPKPLAAAIALQCGHEIEPIDYLTQSLRELAI